MFRPLCGGTANRLARALPPPRSHRGVRLVVRRALGRCVGRPPAAGGRRVLRRERAGRDLPGQGRHRASSRPTQRLGQTSLMRLGVRNTRRQDDPGADRDDLDRRQGGPDLVAALRDPRPPARTSPSRTGRSGSSRPATRNAPATPTPGGAADLQPQDLRLRPAEAGRDHRGGLEAERRRGRALHRPLRGRRRPQRHGEGRDRHRGPARRLLRGADHQGASRTRSSPTAAKSSKSQQASDGSG